MSHKTPNAPIESYAMIGDRETAALVGLDGSIDWLCWPNFGSEACFARLLGSEENGYWQLAPANASYKVSRKYREHTLILDTTFETEEGVVTLTDFMPIREKNSNLVRIVKGIRGNVSMRMNLTLRFGYGLIVPWVRSREEGWTAVAGPDLIVLRTKVLLKGENHATVSNFNVEAGQTVEFVMAYGVSHQPLPRAIDGEKALRQTQKFWQEWASRCQYEGPYSGAVERSLITLEALSYAPTGGIVAAVTTSLPEQIGGTRNWDYRYCWLRDATFTLLALMNGGYYHEAKDWTAWLLRAIAGSPDQVQIMYGIAGERQLVEWEVSGLDGYMNSKPVRVGNAASQQLQLDIYGEVMDAFYHALDRLGKDRALDFGMLHNLILHLEKIWQKPDQGIWETRGTPQHFTYSKVMAWVAFDRAIHVAGKLHANAPVLRWQKLRAKLHEQICKQAYNEKLHSFVQAYGSEELDASSLLIPLIGFLPHDDERVRGTVRAIERKLMPDGLVKRYDTETAQDGLPPGEGVFIACSFWMVSNLKLMGREDEAKKLFERVLALANDVGLLSEEYDVTHKRLVGNFPQAFSHIALVNAAFDLSPHHKSGSRIPGHKSEA